MAGIYPFIEVEVNGQAVSGAFYSRLVSATIHDAPGQDSDTVSVKLDDARNELILPSRDSLMTVKFGFRDAFGGSRAEKMGRFVLDQPQIEFGDQGEFMTLNGRPADMKADLKEPDSEHFDEETLGGIVEKLASRHGMDAKISPALANIKVPYLARVEQSTMDVLTRLADRNRALFSVKDGKLLFLERGQLPALTIHRSECSSGSFTLNPRPIHGQTSAAWFDRKTAKWMFEDHSTGLQGPIMRLRNGLASQGEAKAAAEASGDRLNRATASGSLEMAGRPDIMADAALNLVGFRAEANGLWRAAGVDHKYEQTYTTSIELEAPEGGKT